MPRRKRWTKKMFESTVYNLIRLYDSKTWVKSHPEIGIEYKIVYIPPHVKERLEGGKVA